MLLGKTVFRNEKHFCQMSDLERAKIFIGSIAFTSPDMYKVFHCSCISVYFSLSKKTKKMKKKKCKNEEQQKNLFLFIF